VYLEGSMSITAVGEGVDHPPGLSRELPPVSVVLSSSHDYVM
jgi:hypothetical protein